jgi:hypothetical protein
MKSILIISCVAFFVGSFFDLLTTVLGVSDILGGTFISWVISIAATLVVLALNFQTKEAVLNKQWMVLPFCILAMIFDFYTSMTGEQYLPPEMQGLVFKDILSWITIIIISLLFVASPILLVESLKKLKSEYPNWQ